MPTGPRVMPGRYRCRSVSWDRHGQPGPCATLVPAAEPRSGVAQSAERPAVNRQVASSSLAPRAGKRWPRVRSRDPGCLCLCAANPAAWAAAGGSTVGSNRIVVLTALPLEAAAVRAHLPSPVRHDLPTGTIVEEAALPGTEYSVCLVCTGPGNGQAAVVAERVISWADPAAVLFVGVAGTLKDDIALGDVIAAIRVANYQGGKETAAGFRARLRAGQRSAWEALP